MADWPCRKAARFSTKPNCSTPGGMNLFSLRISVSTLTPTSLLIVAFIVSASKNLPPSLRKRSWNMYMRVGRLAEEGGAVDALALQHLGEAAADRSNCFQVFGAARS